MQYDPSQLAALEAVLRLGSFDAAARQLSVTPSAISQRIKALEDRAGAALVIRATPCTATPAGSRRRWPAISDRMWRAPSRRPGCGWR